MPGVSKWAASAGGEVRVPLGSNSGHEAEVYLGSNIQLPLEHQHYRQPEPLSDDTQYDLVNVRLGVRSLDGVFDIQFWGRNITNETNFLSRGTAIPAP